MAPSRKNFAFTCWMKALGLLGRVAKSSRQAQRVHGRDQRKGAGTLCDATARSARAAKPWVAATRGEKASAPITPKIADSSKLGGTTSPTRPIRGMNIM